MELTIRTDGAEAAGSLREALGEAGDFELNEAGEASVGVVAGAGDASALSAALSGWLQGQPPGSELTVETSTQVFTVHAGDPRAAIALHEAVTREARVAEQSPEEDDPTARDPAADWSGPTGSEDGAPAVGPGTNTDFDTDL